MELAGFVPYYLLKMQHSQARNAFVWAFTLRVCQGSAEVPASLKQVLYCRCGYGCTVVSPPRPHAYARGRWGQEGFAPAVANGGAGYRLKRSCVLSVMMFPLAASSFVCFVYYCTMIGRGEERALFRCSCSWPCHHFSCGEGKPPRSLSHANLITFSPVALCSPKNDETRSLKSAVSCPLTP